LERREKLEQLRARVAVLEEESHALDRGAKIYAEVAGYASTMDAWRLTAPHPEEGLRLVQRCHPEIVLLDLVMPGLGGMELLDRVLAFAPSTDVLLITGHYSTESAVEAIQKGASDYLNKPLSINVLRQRIGKLLEDARRRQMSRRLGADLARIDWQPRRERQPPAGPP